MGKVAKQLSKADTVALWHAVDALAYQCRAMKTIAPPLNAASMDAEWARLTAARRALRKVNAIRTSGIPALDNQTFSASSTGGVESE